MKKIELESMEILQGRRRVSMQIERVNCEEANQQGEVKTSFDKGSAKDL